MPSVSEQRLFDALATLSRAFADGGVPDISGEQHEPARSAAIAAMDEESREVLGEASLAVAFGAFASRGGDSGPIHMLIGAMGLMALLTARSPTRRPRSSASPPRTGGWSRRSTAPARRWIPSSAATRPARR